MTVATKVCDDLDEGVERWIGERFHVGQGGRSLSYIGEVFFTFTEKFLWLPTFVKKLKILR